MKMNEEIGAIVTVFLLLATTMPPSNVSQKLSALAGTWPKDPLRPNLQLTNFLKSLATHPNLTEDAVQATQDLQHNVVLKKVRVWFCGSSIPGANILLPYESTRFRRKCWSLRRDRIITRVWWRAMTRACKGLRGHGGRHSSTYGKRGTIFWVGLTTCFADEREIGRG